MRILTPLGQVIRDFADFRKTVTEIEWVWLVSLLVGILAAVVALASLIERLLDEQPVRMASLFLGLIIGSVWVAGRMIDRFDAATVAIMMGVGAAMFLLLGLRTDTEVADDALEVVTKPSWIFFLAGAIAICAMILPGISGSFILVMLGMYTEVLGAVNDRDFGQRWGRDNDQLGSREHSSEAHLHIPGPRGHVDEEVVEIAPWTIINSNDKKRARLGSLHAILSTVAYANKDSEVANKPDPYVVRPASVLTIGG